MLEYIAGREVIPLVNLLKTKENISEFKLAEDLKCEVNYVRNLLYRLYDYNLVFFTRKKDKLKGWYIYYWTFNHDKILDVLIKIEKERLERLKSRHDSESGGLFFCCQGKCVRLDFEHATDFEFHCPECGEIVHQDDNTGHISKISEQIKISEDRLNKFETELADEMNRRAKEGQKEEKLLKAKAKKEEEEKAKKKKKVLDDKKAKKTAKLAKSNLKKSRLKESKSKAAKARLAKGKISKLSKLSLKKPAKKPISKISVKTKKSPAKKPIKPAGKSTGKPVKTKSKLKILNISGKKTVTKKKK